MIFEYPEYPDIGVRIGCFDIASNRSAPWSKTALKVSSRASQA
jgi:hypothetical protein